MSAIIKSSVVVLAVAAAVVGATTAYFSDTETAENNLFTAGTLDLKVNDKDITTEKFFASNVVPGDTGTVDIKLTNDGTVDGNTLTLTFSSFVNNDNGCTEPESTDGDSTCGPTGGGELGANATVVIEEIDGIGGSVIGTIEPGKTLNSLGTYTLTGGLKAGDSRYFRLTASIDSSVGNVIQSDSVEFDITAGLTQN